MYYRDNVPDGEYKVYANGALVRERYQVGVKDTQITTAKIQDKAVTVAKVEISGLLPCEILVFSPPIAMWGSWKLCEVETVQKISSRAEPEKMS